MVGSRSRRCRFGLPLASFATLTLAACQTPTEVREDEGKGPTRTYVASFDSMWEAMPAVVHNAGLELADEDETSGTVLASHGLSPFSFGENVAIFVRDRGDTLTEVEVVSKPALATNVFANDWSDEIFDQVGDRFRGYIALEPPEQRRPSGPTRLTPIPETG